MPNRVQVLKQVARNMDAGEKFFLQWCRYVLDSGDLKYGYRFMWGRDGRFVSARGQARIPSLALASEMINEAIAEGWGNNVDDGIS